MARSRKDGRNRGGHREAARMDREYWSRRCTDRTGRVFGMHGKRYTHRYERREAVRITREQLAEMAA